MDYNYKDLSLLKRCLSQRWSLTDEQRRRVLDRVLDIATTGPDKHAIAAFRALVDAERLDLQSAELAVKAAAVKVMDDAVQGSARGLSDSELADGVARLLEPAAEGDVGQGFAGRQIGPALAMPLEGDARSGPLAM